MAARLAILPRNLSTQKVLQSSLQKPLPESATHAKHEGHKMWRNLFFFGCCPAMCLGFINLMLMEEKPRPEFIKYPYLRIRRKKYPWRDGVKTLFHNPHVNALPDGYEDAH